MSVSPPDHLLIVPVLLPVLGAVATILLARGAPRRAAALGAAVAAATTVVAAALVLRAASQGIAVYELGGWSAPIGIVLVLDRASALLVLLASFLTLSVSLSAVEHPDTDTASFHALSLLMLMGVNGAFLTGDLFNLFVCFEILLAASYGLLVQGAGREAARAGFHYAALNVLGSSLFLIALGIVYGTAGTLNLADLSLAAPQVPEHSRGLLGVGCALLLVVFGLKAALVPTHLWLPRAYAAAPGPVAALFAIGTKVGAYAILRVLGTTFGGLDGAMELASPLVLGMAAVTTLLAALGALGTLRLRRLAAFLTLLSVGTLMLSIGLFDIAGTSAALYYIVHSTLATAALFLIADAIARARGDDGDRLEAGAPMAHAGWLGVPFLIAGVTIVGFPPASGFIGKLLVLRAGLETEHGGWILGLVLSTSLLAIVALSRAGSRLFWKTEGARPAAPLDRCGMMSVALLLGAIAGIVIFAEPLGAYARAAAEQLMDPSLYVRTVLGEAS